MAIDSVPALLDVLRRHALLEPEQLAELPAVAAPFTDVKALSKDLIRRGWLTPYQVNQLAQGRAGQLVLGQYVLLERLGAGGMGQVFKARHQKLGRIIALKVIRQEHLSNSHAVNRFKREAQAAAQLDHPHIVRVYDAGEDLGTHYLVMELVEGEDLGRTLKKSGRLPVHLACVYARQVATGLQHAHERGLVHRDVKPGNIVITRPPQAKEGQVKILDMGLARIQPLQQHEGLALSMTREGVVVGTLDYMAPEQAKSSHNVDGRADLYGLGCTLYHLLSGRVPFVEGSGMEKLLRHQLDPVPPLKSLRPEVPDGLADVVHKLLAKKPEDRYATAAEVVRALEPYCDPNGVAEVPRAVPVAPPPVAEAPEPAWSPTPPRPRRDRSHRTLYLALAMLVVPLLVLLIAAVAFQMRPQPTTASPSAATTTRREPPRFDTGWASFTRYITDDTVLITTVNVAKLLHSPVGEKHILPGFREGVGDLRPLFAAVKIDAETDLDRVTALSPADNPDRPLVVLQGRFQDAQFPTDDDGPFRVRTSPKGLNRGIRLFELKGDKDEPALILGVVGTDTIVAGVDPKVVQETLLRPPNKMLPVRDLVRELNGQEAVGFVGFGHAMARVEVIDKFDPERVVADSTTFHGQIFFTDEIKTEVVFSSWQQRGPERLKELLDKGLRNALLLAFPVGTTRPDLRALKQVIKTGTFSVEGRTVIFRGLVTAEMLEDGR